MLEWEYTYNCSNRSYIQKGVSLVFSANVEALFVVIMNCHCNVFYGALFCLLGA
jgi:hypothetical protein